VFTGLVEAMGTIEGVRASDAGRELVVACAYDDLVEGESIALNGACLTVRDCAPGRFSVAAVVTTLGRTTIGDWQVGRRVNLERATRAGDRLGGHIVQGHVDAVATVRSLRQSADALLIDIDVPGELVPLLVPHGSVTVDGVSLTVNSLPEDGVLQVSIIEYTRRHTTLGALGPGDEVHIEADVIGKFVQRLVDPYLHERRAAPRA
jgi:riboflavin synthase